MADFTDLYPYVPKTTSYIKDEDAPRPATTPNPNAIILIGTATKGPLYTPTLMEDETLSDIFGDYVDDGYGEAMLVKGYREIKSMVPSAFIYGVRIGDVRKPKLDLYENRNHANDPANPDLAPTGISACMTIISKIDGENSTEVKIDGDSNGDPAVMTVTLPDGTVLSYQLDVFGNTPGAYYNVTDLVDALNADAVFAQYNVAQANVLTDEVNITITDMDSNGTIDTEYDLTSPTGKSYGDKLIDIIQAINKTGIVDSTSVKAGDAESTLAGAPIKDADPNTNTITSFYTIKAAEELLNTQAADVGTTLLNLACRESGTNWDNTGADAIKDYVLYRTRAGVTTHLVEGPTIISENDTVSSVAGNTITLGTALSQDYTTAATVSRAEATTTLASDANAGDTDIVVNGVAGILVNDTITIDDGTNNETATVTAVNSGTNTITVSAGLTNSYAAATPTNVTRAAANTTLSAAASSGDTSIDVADATGFVGGAEITISETVAGDWHWNTNDITTGQIELTSGAQLGDIYFIDYRYKTLYIEANLRSELQIGNRFSYFVYGSKILFGAAQLYPLELTYQTRHTYTPGVDIMISDAKGGKVKFINPDNYPEEGSVVSLLIRFQPELPAVTGTVIDATQGIVQASQLTNGNDGRRLVGMALYNELEKGYIGQENIPARYVVPLGVHIDDVVDSIDYETGLPTVVSAGFLEQLSKYVSRKSRYVSEAFGIISPKPINAADINNPTLEEIVTWYDRLVNVSPTDPTRPANIVSSFDDYHIIIPVGDAVFVVNGIKNGRPYIGQFAAIHAGLMQNKDPKTAMVMYTINTGPIQRLIYPIMNNEWINRINGMRYTLYTQSMVDGTYLISDAPTLARAESKFDRQFVVQTVFDIIQTVRTIARPFFGRANDDKTRKSLEIAIDEKVKSVYAPDRIQGFAVTVHASDTDKISGKTQVSLHITTSKEIRNIAIVTQLDLV